MGMITNLCILFCMWLTCTCCGVNRAPDKIEVKFTIDNDLVASTFEHSIDLDVEKGLTLLEIMENAASQNSNFEFQYQDYEGLGAFITEINGLAQDTTNKLYWMVYKRTPGEQDIALDVGLSSYIREDGEHIVFKYTSVGDK